jgi:tetratricopeptide (TPR) repeat protein
MLRTLKSSFVALALLAMPAIAHAEEPTKSYPDCGREPTDAEVNAAKGAFQAGQASFNEADYARAIDYWEDAFRRDCTANPLLLNLARAYELAGRKRQAVVALETYLAREPNSGEKDQINRRIEVLKKKIAEEDATAAATPPPPPPSTGTAPVNGPQPAETPAADKRGYSPWPWVLIGVGGAGTVLGVVGVVSNNKKLSDAEAACPSRMGCDASITDKGNKARSGLTTSGVIAGVGVAVAAGGVVWLIIDHKNVNQSNQARLTPLVGQGFAGLSFDGSF